MRGFKDQHADYIEVMDRLGEVKELLEVPRAIMGLLAERSEENIHLFNGLELMISSIMDELLQIMGALAQLSRKEVN